MASAPAQLAVGRVGVRIAVVCPYAFDAPGGVQSIVTDLVNRLRAEGDDAFAVGPGTPSELGVDVGGSIAIPGNGSNAPVALNPAVRGRVRSVLADSDIVHVHEPMIPFVSTSALAVDVPTVATFHSAIAPWTVRFYRLLESVGSRMLGDATLTAVSAMALAGLPDSWAPVTIVPNAIDVAAFRLDVNKVEGRVVAVGRDDPRKGLDVLLEAWPAVIAVHPDAELHVIGAKRPAVDRVVFHGRVGDLEKREIVASSEVYVAPHLGGESFGIVLAEAMASGCAVVASDLAAFRSVGGEAATYVPVEDRRSIAAAVVGLLDDRSLISTLVARGFDRVGNYDWTHVLGGYRVLYESAANTRN